MRTLRQKPKLIINPLVREKIKQLVTQSDDEIAWHGFIKREDMNFYLYDIILYPQYNTKATSTSDDNEYAEWLIKQMNYDNFMDMRLHGHSHVNMSCSPSATDTNFRKNILKNLKKDDFYIFLIVNKKDDYSLELIDYEDNIVYETKDIEVLYTEPKVIEKAIEWSKTAIKNNVKEKICLTTTKAASSSTQRLSPKRYTSLEQAQLEEMWLKHWQELDYQ